MTTSLDPRVAIRVLYDLVRNFFNVTLALWVAVFPADKSLGGKKGVFRVDNGLALGRDTNQPFAVLRKGND